MLPQPALDSLNLRVACGSGKALGEEALDFRSPG